MSDATAGRPKISSEFAARYEAGVRGLGADLGIPEAEVLAALEFTTGHTAECLRPEELEMLPSLSPDRREHIRTCDFCGRVEQAMNAAAVDSEESEFVALATEGPCPTCGRARSGVESFLGSIGLSDDMVTSLKSSFHEVDIPEYLSTAKHYLTISSKNVGTYAKKHPGQVAAGVATLAIGAGLLYKALHED